MKKIFTLFCALTLMLGTNVAQTAPKAISSKKAPAAVEQVRNAKSIQFAKTSREISLPLEGTQLVPMQSTNFSPAAPASAMKANGQKAQVKTLKANDQKAQVLKVNNPQAKMTLSAKQAKANLQISPVAESGTAQEITAVSFEIDSESQPGESIVYLYSSKTFCFGIVGDVELDKEYAFADLDADLTFWYNNSGYKDATDATFKMWEEDGLTHISATMVDAGGDEYNISYIEPEARTEDVVIEGYKFQDYSSGSDGNYYYILTDNETGNIFYFDVYFDGTFEYGYTYTVGNDGIGTYDSGVKTPEGIITINDASFCLSLDDDNLIHIVASMITATNVTYNITYDQPKPQDVDVTAIDWAYDESYCDVYVYSENTTYLFELTEDLVYGKDYTFADMYPSWTCTLTSSGYPDIKATDATLKVTKDEAGLIHIAATMVLNGSTHKITFDEKPFEPSGVQIDVNGTDLNGRYLSSYGFCLYTATWGDYTVQLAFDATEEKATYTGDDLNTNYSLIYSDDEQIQLFKLASDITITTTDKTKTLTGSIYAKNGDEYIMNLYYEKPAVEQASAIVEDAKLTKTSQFFHVDGNDTQGAYGITLYVVTKNLEGEFTVEDLDVYSSGVSELSTKKWFDIDSCEIVSEMFGSNTLVINGILHTSNASLDRMIDMTFVMTARVDAKGELMDIYGGIVAPAKGDTLSFTRSGTGTAFFKNSSGQLSFANQSGKATMVAVNDSVYYWYNPISKFTTGYWIKGFKDNEANAIVFDRDQVINVYNSGALNGLMGWVKVTTAGSISLDQEYSDVFALDIKGTENDSLVLRGSAPFDFTQDVHFPGVYVDGYGFQGYGDAGTILALNKPIAERDTVDVVSNTMTYNEFIESNKAVQYYAGEDGVAQGYETFCMTSKNATSIFGTYDLYSSGTCWADLTDGSSVSFDEGKLTIVEEEKGIRLTGWAIGDDEKYYRLNWYKQTVFDERDTIQVNGQGIIISECLDSQTEIQTGWLYRMTNDDYQYVLLQSVGKEKYGTFSYEAKTLGKNYYNICTTAGARQQFVDGEMTIGEVGDSIVLDGEFIAEDNKVYVVHFTQSNKVLNYDTDAPFDATFKYADMSASIDEGVIGIYATNEENLTIGLELYADAEATEIPAGTYTISDTQEAGTALKSQGVVGGYLTECWAGTRGTNGIEDCWFMVDGTITLSYDEYGKLNVAVDAKNSYGQSVTATVTYTKVEPKDTVSMEGTFVVGEKYQASYGLYYYDIMSTDSLYNAVLFAETDEMTGDLASKIDFGDCAIYTYEGDELSIIDVYEFVVSAVGKKMQLTAKVLADNLTMYDITANCFYGAIDGDAQEAFTATYSTEEISDVFSSKAKMHVISACDEAGDSIHIVFKSSQNPLEARTYEITTSGSLNTVVASDGTATSLNAVSFAAKKNDGEIDKLWHMVSGTVTIDEAGNITVDALNSYDQKITININVPLPDYYLYNYNNGKYLGWNGASTDKNKISMMSEADRMPVAITLTDADNKRFTTAVTATDGKVMYLSMGTGFNFHSGSPYTGEQDNGYWYQVKDINASTIVADKVSEIVEGEYYIIVHNFNGYCALSGTVIDTDGNGKMRISGYKLASAGDELTFAYNDIKDCIYRYVTATTPAPEPRPTEEPVVEGNILDEESFNFNGGTVGNWLSAGSKNAEVSVVAPGYNNSAYAMKVTTATAGANYDTQVKYVGNYINGHTYSFSFKAKASENVNIVVALQQDGGAYQGVYSMPISLTTEWAEFSGELTVNGDNFVRFLLNVGETAADYFFDQIVLIDETAKSVMPIMMNGEDMIFNTAGQRILNPVKGNVYIINGKQTLFE